MLNKEKIGSAIRKILQRILPTSAKKREEVIGLKFPTQELNHMVLFSPSVADVQALIELIPPDVRPHVFIFLTGKPSEQEQWGWLVNPADMETVLRQKNIHPPFYIGNLLEEERMSVSHEIVRKAFENWIIPFSQPYYHSPGGKGFLDSIKRPSPPSQQESDENPTGNERQVVRDSDGGTGD